MVYTKLLIVHILLSLIPLYIFLPITLKFEHDYNTQKHMKRKDRKNARELADVMWFCLICALILVAVDIVPLLPDLVDTQYECVYGDYEMVKDGRYDKIKVTSEDGEVMVFTPLKGFRFVTGEQYPFYECKATVWYTSHGCYAVDVIVYS